MITKITKGIGLGIVGAVVGIAAGIVGILAILLLASFGAIMGAIVGFVVSAIPVLGPLVKEGFMSFGIVDPNLVAIGAAVGFVAGFFKGNSSCPCRQDGCG
ncbi:MAG: hypothetical protein WC492_03675 [Candidatus Micrarchaeia archaeon]